MGFATLNLPYDTASCAVRNFPPARALSPQWGPKHRMPISRNVLFLIIGALIVAVAALSYKVYEDHREPKGVQFSIGPSGISVQKK